MIKKQWGFGPQICSFTSAAKVEWITEQSVPYATHGTAWVGYDNQESFTAKVKKDYLSQRISQISFHNFTHFYYTLFYYFLIGSMAHIHEPRWGVSMDP